MPAFRTLVTLACLMPLTGCMITVNDSIRENTQVVEQVDLSRYAGLWYEISSVPSIASTFGRCTNTTATYTAQDDGTIRLFNQCFLDSFDGRESNISGQARPLDDSNARLAILFDNFIFEASYNIIALDPDYQWAIVGSGDNGLFILSRTPQMDQELYDSLLALLPDLGYNAADLLLTAQEER